MDINDILKNIPLDMDKIKTKQDVISHFSVLATQAEELGDMKLAKALDETRAYFEYLFFGVPDELIKDDFQRAMKTIDKCKSKEMDKDEVQSSYNDVIDQCEAVKEKIKEFVQAENAYKKKHGEASGCSRWEFLHGIWSEITDEAFPEID